MSVVVAHYNLAAETARIDGVSYFVFCNRGKFVVGSDVPVRPGSVISRASGDWVVQSVEINSLTRLTTVGVVPLVK